MVRQVTLRERLSCQFLSRFAKVLVRTEGGHASLIQVEVSLTRVIGLLLSQHPISEAILLLSTV